MNENERLNPEPGTQTDPTTTDLTQTDTSSENSGAEAAPTVEHIVATAIDKLSDTITRALEAISQSQTSMHNHLLEKVASLEERLTRQSPQNTSSDTRDDTHSTPNFLSDLRRDIWD